VEGTDFEFVDGTSSTTRHPKVKFVTPNAYTISLTVANAAGTNTLTKESYITINQLTEVPIANFSSNHTQIMSEQTILFTDLSTNIPIAWNWGISPGEEGTDFTFVNGTGRESKNPEVQFNTSGYFTIQLIATNPVGDSEPHIKVDYIEVVPTFVMQNGEATICAGMFFDSGGPESNYQNNENYTFTFHPSRENANIKVEFKSFDVESQSTCNWDRLLIFDGDNTEATQLGRFCGSSNPGTLIATNGSLTFQFISDNIITRAGWAANIMCHGPFHDVTFSIMGHNGPLEGAQIEVAGHNLNTTHEGIATINLEFGTHYYSVNKDGYWPVTGSFTLSEQMSVEVTMQPVYGVTFNVEANQSPIEGANVGIDGRNLLTTAQGIVTLSLPNGVYDYNVSKQGYAPVSGKVVVDGNSEEVNITLIPFSQITFNVTSNDEPIEGATIVIDNEDMVTNQNGEATISIVSGLYDFTVSKEGYQTFEGQVDATGAPVSINVKLQPLYVVTFQVATSGGPLYQAEVKVGGHTLHTNDTGHADVALPPGSYPYEVTYMDFPTIPGTINISDENVFVGVLLETSISVLALQEVKLFPNPFRDKIYLNGATELKEVVVTNLNGQVVLRVSSGGSDSMQIQTGSMPSGVYLIKLVGKNNETFIHKMVKQ
jgi:PKD repeat protein